jgi:hypothetical protein
MTATTQERVESRTGRWGRRFLVTTAAIGAAIGVYLVENLVLAEKLASPAMNGQPPAPLTLSAVLGMSLSAAWLGWLLLAVLERMVPHGRTVWRIVALVVLVVSLAGPFTGAGITMTNRLGLALLHVTVGAILIPFLPGARRRTDVAR